MNQSMLAFDSESSPLAPRCMDACHLTRLPICAEEVRLKRC
jgi:hypothetical protein